MRPRLGKIKWVKPTGAEELGAFVTVNDVNAVAATTQKRIQRWRQAAYQSDLPVIFLAGKFPEA